MPRNTSSSPSPSFVRAPIARRRNASAIRGGEQGEEPETKRRATREHRGWTAPAAASGRAKEKTQLNRRQRAGPRIRRPPERCFLGPPSAPIPLAETIDNQLCAFHERKGSANECTHRENYEGGRRRGRRWKEEEFVHGFQWRPKIELFFSFLSCSSSTFEIPVRCFLSLFSLPLSLFSLSPFSLLSLPCFQSNLCPSLFFPQRNQAKRKGPLSLSLSLTLTLLARSFIFFPFFFLCFFLLCLFFTFTLLPSVPLSSPTFPLLLPPSRPPPPSPPSPPSKQTHRA